MILDTQIHLWEAERPDRPWDPIRKPSLPRPFGPEDFLPLMDAAGVDRAIIVPPGIMNDRSAFALECAARWPDRFAVMGLIDTLAPDVADRVARWRDQPGMLGIRTHLHDSERAKWPTPTALDPFWAACEHYQAPVAVFCAGSLTVVKDVLARFPTLKLIIDHVGMPLIDVGFLYPDFPDLLALHRYPNVAVKLSTLPPRSRVGYPFPETHAVIRQVIDAFGPERAFWGSDHTQTLARGRATYQEEVDLFRRADFLTDAERRMVLGEAAAAYLGWPPGVPSTAITR